MKLPESRARREIFFRRSHYDFTGSDLPPLVGEPGRRTITQRNPEARVFLAWTLSNR